jgi:hypothetical protein
MHHGLVHLLRGIVLYVRNPEQHETSSVVDDKVAAFERLSLLSLCARHIDQRTHSITIEDAIAELRQERFPNTADARRELIAAVPAAQHIAFAKELVEAAQQARIGSDLAMESRCRTAHRQLSRFVAERNRPHVLVEIAREIDRLVSRDRTLDFGIRLVTSPVYERLAPRNQRKVTARVLEDLKEGTRTRVRGEGVFHRDAARIFPALAPADRQEFLRIVESALTHHDSQRQTYGVWMAMWTSRYLRRSETERLACLVAEAAAGQAEVVAELRRRVRSAAAYEFRRALHEQLALVEARTPDAETGLAEARELVAVPNVRVRRSRR